MPRILLLSSVLCSLLLHGILFGLSEQHSRELRALPDVSARLTLVPVMQQQAEPLSRTSLGPLPLSSVRSRQVEMAVQASPYWSPTELDSLPVPVSAPDVSLLGGADLPMPRVHLRLFVAASGRVDEVRVQDDDAQTEQWAPLLRMFRETGFIPARRAGVVVASYLDIEVDISELRRVL